MQVQVNAGGPRDKAIAGFENELEIPTYMGTVLATDQELKTWDSVPDFAGSFLYPK